MKVGSVLADIYVSGCSVFAFVIGLEGLDAWAYAIGVDGGLHAWGACFEDVEGVGSHIAIDEDDFGGGALDEGFGYLAAFEQVAFEYDSFMGRLIGAHEEVDLLLVLLKGLLDGGEATINSFLEGNELVVDAVALEEVLLEDVVCPCAEEDALRRMDAISHG